MAAQRPAGASLVELIDSSRLTPRFWNATVVVMLAAMLEFFDFFLVGFVLAIVVKPWHLTFGESSIVLFSAGIGAIAGSFLWGWLADRFGRKPAILLGIVVFAGGTGLQALTPEGWWWLLAILRLLVGAGVGGLASVWTPLIIEFTPTRHRTVLGGLSAACIPLGTLLGSLLAATLTGVIGWRGLFAVGAIPGLLAIWAYFALPESPRWLIVRGRPEQARTEVSRIFGHTPAEVAGAVAELPSRGHDRVSYAALARYPKSFWFTVIAWFGLTTMIYGVTLWGPTLLTLMLRITPAHAAFLFIFVTIGGFGGRLLFSFLPRYIGRRGCGMLMGLGAGVFYVLTAVFHDALLGGVSLFWLGLIAAEVFSDGGFSNLAPYTPEAFPAPLRGHAMGLAEVVNGMGKIVGPIGLGLIAGASNVVNPEATVGAITPGFLYIAAFGFVVFLTFLFINVETRGRSLEALETDLLAQERPAGAARRVEVE